MLSTLSTIIQAFFNIALSWELLITCAAVVSAMSAGLLLVSYVVINRLLIIVDNSVGLVGGCCLSILSVWTGLCLLLLRRVCV